MENISVWHSIKCPIHFRTKYHIYYTSESTAAESDYLLSMRRWSLRMLLVDVRMYARACVSLCVCVYVRKNKTCVVGSKVGREVMTERWMVILACSSAYMHVSNTSNTWFGCGKDARAPNLRHTIMIREHLCFSPVLHCSFNPGRKLFRAECG